MNAWYNALNRPPLTPPDWVFAPVWSCLYAMIAAAVVLYFRSPGKPHVILTTVVLSLHLAANLVWTSLFFGLRAPGLALLDIIVMDLTLAVLIRWFLQVNALAGLLLVPYLAWGLFATYLNAAFWRLN